VVAPPTFTRRGYDVLAHHVSPQHLAPGNSIDQPVGRLIDGDGAPNGLSAKAAVEALGRRMSVHVIPAILSVGIVASTCT
jgi:hypothetical protein